MTDGTDRAKEDLRVDLLDAFYLAFKSGVDPDEARDLVEETMEIAADDAGVAIEDGDRDA